MEDTRKKRFDYAIMNPPYDRSLHLKFLEKVIKVADKTVNISPVRWLQDPLARYKKNSDYYKYKSIVDTIESLAVISAKDSQKLFEVARFGTDLGIYTCGKGGFNTDINSLTSRFTKYCITHPAPFENGKKDGFRVRIPAVKLKGDSCNRTNKTVGNYEFLGRLFVFENGCKDGLKWHEWYSKNQHSKTTDEITCSIKFNSKAEAENFIASTDTAVFKYVSHQVIRDVHITSDKVLWMDDYTTPWTNARFCEYFSITGFISDTEAEPGSEWETILETMKKYA